MIQVLDLRKDGTEQPQLFLLSFRDPSISSAGYRLTMVSGTEDCVREVLKKGGIPKPAIEELFKNAH